MSMPVTAPDTAIIREAARRAIGEDIGPADITTMALVPEEATCRARIFCKQEAVLSGVPVALQVFRELDPGLSIEAEKQDASQLASGDTVIRMNGKTRSVLTGERSALNLLQHLSGIATETSRYVRALGDSRCQILDTRKTIPGLRQLQKYAVRCGGGRNHRFGLYDAFMAKDNHVAHITRGLGLEGLRQAVREMRSFDPGTLLIFEADNLDQVRILAECQVDQILLDNMSLLEMEEAVQLVKGRSKLEASGNMTLERIPAVAKTGVDYISVGALTHSVQAVDFSLEITETTI